MSARLFAALDTEWELLGSSRPARQAIRRWRNNPALSCFSTLEDLIGFVRGAGDAEAIDQVLVALVRRSPHDDVAARTLLQAILPGLFNVARRIGHGRIDDDLESDVVAEAMSRIRTYPLARRPRAVAANITWDVFGRLHRARTRNAKLTIEPTDTIPSPRADAAAGEMDAAVELRCLITQALRSGRLREPDARLLVAISLEHDTLRRQAEREGIAYAAMNERWRRARNRLRLAVAA